MRSLLDLKVALVLTSLFFGELSHANPGLRCNQMKMATSFTQLPFKTSFQEMVQCKYSNDTGERLFLAQPGSMSPVPNCDFDPQLTRISAQEQQAVNQRIGQYLQQHTGSREAELVYTLPVVFHVIHQGEPIGVGNNISEAQIQSALTELNNHFRKVPGTNGNGNGVDVRIQFQRAVRDPNNNPTNGILRVNGAGITNYVSQGIAGAANPGANEMDIKNLSRWDQTNYINIWVVHKIGNGTGIQGYATFPTTNPSDGIVILHSALGTSGTVTSNNNKSTTLSHEMGHYLSLYHTFHSTTSCVETNCATQGDRICDTPATTQNTSCSNPACQTNPQPQNVNLYMDYTGESCKNSFSQGQKDRMRASLMTERASLLSSNALTPVVANDVAIMEVVSPLSASCSSSSEVKLLIGNFGQSTLTSFNLKIKRPIGLPISQNKTVNIPAGTSQVVSFNPVTLASGLNNLKFTVSAPNGQPDGDGANNSKTKKVVFGANSSSLTVSISLDHFGSETTWDIKTNAGELIQGGGPYTNNTPNAVQTSNVCLPAGCYVFTMRDSYGDGQSLVNGSFSLSEGSSVIASGSGDWGSQQVHNFCVD